MKDVFGSADGESAEFQAADIEDVEGDDVAAASLAEQVVDRHRGVIEEDGRGGTALDAHLLFFSAAGDAGKGAFDQKRTELFTINFGEYGEEVGFAAFCDPHLLDR